MKVLVVVPSISRAGGGVSEVARLLALGVRKSERIEVEVLTFIDDFTQEDLVNWEGVPVRAYKFFGPSNFAFSPGLFWAVLRSDAKVIHVHGIWMFHCFAVTAANFLRGKKYLVSVHGMLEPWILKRSPRLKKIIALLYQNFFFKRASVVHVLNEKEESDTSSYLKGKSQLKVIPNFVSEKPLVETLPSWYSENFVNKDVYLFLGRIHDKKGWRELCKAWEMICGLDDVFARRSVLVFCGWQDGVADFESIVETCFDEFENVIYAGPQYGSDKDSALRIADFFILPSKSEGLPMVILEAWSAGTPVLMTKECNLQIGFVQGAALEIGQDVNSIAVGLRKASAMTKQERQLMSARGKKLVDSDFSENAVCEEFLTLYKQA